MLLTNRQTNATKQQYGLDMFNDIQTSNMEIMCCIGFLSINSGPNACTVPVWFGGLNHLTVMQCPFMIQISWVWNPSQVKTWGRPPWPRQIFSTCYSSVSIIQVCSSLTICIDRPIYQSSTEISIALRVLTNWSEVVTLHSSRYGKYWMAKYISAYMS